MSDLARHVGSLTVEQFVPRLNETFRLRHDASIVDLVLVQAAALGGSQGSRPGRRPFSLIFRGPRAPVLSQRTYALEHPHMGAMDLFIVPIGPDRDGMRYEAIFT
jgi:uncharacterized protein DUF6916